MKKYIRILLLFSLMLVFTGCAHVISKDLRASADPLLTFTQVRQNPDNFKGKLVIWGGEIIETVNQKDGNTLLEIFQKPLDLTEEPKYNVDSEGRFMVLMNGYLDPYIYNKGRKITVAGVIEGSKTKPLGEMEYKYPFLMSKQIYIWPKYYYAAYPYYYDPWYPYWWGGVTIGIPIHHHH